MDLERDIQLLNQNTALIVENLDVWDDSNFDGRFVDGYGGYIEVIQNKISESHFHEAYRMMMVALHHSNISNLSCYRMIYCFLIPWIKRTEKDHYYSSILSEKVKVTPDDLRLMLDISMRKNLLSLLSLYIKQHDLKERVSLHRQKAFDLIQTLWPYTSPDCKHCIIEFYTSLKPTPDDYNFLSFCVRSRINFEIRYDLFVEKAIDNIVSYDVNDFDENILINVNLSKSIVENILTIYDRDLSIYSHARIFMVLIQAGIWDDYVMKKPAYAKKIWDAITRKDFYSSSTLTGEVIPRLFIFLRRHYKFIDDENSLYVIFRLIIDDMDNFNERFRNEANLIYTNFGHDEELEFHNLDFSWLKSSIPADVTINNKQYHSVVLCTISEFFRACFTGNFRESSSRCVNLEDDNVLLHHLLESFYTGVLHVSSMSLDELEYIIETANMLLIKFDTDAIQCRLIGLFWDADFEEQHKIAKFALKFSMCGALSSFIRRLTD